MPFRVELAELASAGHPLPGFAIQLLVAEVTNLLREARGTTGPIRMECRVQPPHLFVVPPALEHVANHKVGALRRLQADGGVAVGADRAFLVTGQASLGERRRVGVGQIDVVDCLCLTLRARSHRVMHECEERNARGVGAQRP
jgi:hypothetical protein